MLEAINYNQGAIMVLLTFFVVLSSILSWVWSRKQLHQMKIQWKKSEEPYIIVGVEGIDSMVYFSVINTGNEPAINVKFKFEDRFIENLNEPEEKKDILKNFGKIGLSLTPKKIVYIPTYCRYANIQDETIKLIITYSSIHGDAYNQELSFDLKMYGAIKEFNHYANKKISSISDNRDSLKSISESLRRISNSVDTKNE